MAKVGRKSTFNDKIREAILRLLKEGKTIEEVAEIIGVSKRTIYNWQGKHVELLHAAREAKLAADELVEASLFSRAVGYSHPEQKVFCDKGEIITHEMEKHYPPDTQAAMFWLRNRQPERWKEKTEGDVNVNNTTNVTTLSDEQISVRIQALLEKSGQKP